MQRSHLQTWWRCHRFGSWVLFPSHVKSSSRDAPRVQSSCTFFAKLSSINWIPPLARVASGDNHARWGPVSVHREGPFIQSLIHTHTHTRTHTRTHTGAAECGSDGWEQPGGDRRLRPRSIRNRTGEQWLAGFTSVCLNTFIVSSSTGETMWSVDVQMSCTTDVRLVFRSTFKKNK